MSLKRLTIYLFVLFLLQLNFSWAKDSDDRAEEKVDSSITKSYTVKVETKLGPLVAQIHTSELYRPMVARISDILRNESKELLEYFQWVPDDTIHIIIRDAVNASNGFATVFPRLKIEINDFPPVGYSYLNSSGDWLKNLLLHELVHIVHMSQHRGILDLVDTVFGSIGRSMTGLVPRWFTEGIAVWAETKFTESGRLRDEMMVFESRKALLSEQFCKNTECLSLPGKYPYGHTPYWLGGMFMEHLEKLKPGTIRCLIHANSSKIPFFLEEVFAQCLDGEPLYLAFHKWLLFEQVQLQAAQMKNQSLIKEHELKPLDFSHKATVWYKGAELRGDQLYYVENNENRFVDELAVTNVYNPQEHDLIRTHGPLMSISKINSHQNEIQLEERPFIGDTPPDWWKFNTQSKEQSLITDRGANLYFYKVDEEKSFSFRYSNFSWKLYEIDGKNQSSLIQKFSDSVQIYWPYLNNQKELEFLTYDWRKGLYEFHSLNAEKKIQTNFSYKGQLFLMDRCQGHSVLRLDDGKLGIYKDGSLKTFKNPFTENIVQFKGSELATAFWLESNPQEVFVAEKSCDEFIASLKDPKTETTKEVKPQETLEENFEVKDFNRWAHLAPNYWFASILVGPTVSFYRLFTSISDPTERLNFAINVDHYPTIGEVGGVYSMSYLFDDNWSITGFFNQSYNVSTINGNTENQSSTGGAFGKSEIFGRWNYSISASFYEANENDYLSSRKSKRYTISQILNMNRYFNDDFLNRLTLSAGIYKQNTEGRSNFIGQDYFLYTSYYLSSNWLAHWDFSYSKMDKRDIFSGSIFAGERNRHSVYGLDTSAAFSNELSRSRFHFDINIFDNLKNFFGMPLYLRQTRLLLGGEWLKSDYIFLGTKFLIKEDVTSVHAGLRFKIHAFYYLPVTIDTIFAKTTARDGTSASRYFIQMDGFIF